MTGSGLWVGPMGSDRYRLVSLLGGGGEGEVWRAVDAQGAEFAVKILPALGDTFARAVWDEQSQLLPTIRHRGLVRIHEVFTAGDKHDSAQSPLGETEFRYVVMDYEPGPTLADWVTENSDASVGQRLALLQSVAATLDWIHEGAGSGAPMAHGDVKPSNVIIRADGSTVLVDLGLFRLTTSAGATGHSRPYAAPELRERFAAATQASDAYAFAATTAYALTGGPLPVAEDGYLDHGVVRRRLLTTPALKQHRRLVDGVLGALAADTSSRPTELEPWLSAHRPRRTALLASAAALVMTGVAASTALAITLTANDIPSRALPQAGGSYQGLDKPRVLTINDPAPPPATVTKAAPKPSPSLPASPPRVPGSAPLVEVYSWPFESGCDIQDALAMPASGVSFRAMQTSGDRLADTLTHGGGPWKRGLLSFHLTPQSTGVTITNLHVTGELTTSPAWVLFPQQDPSIPGEPCAITNPPSPDRRPEDPIHYHASGDFNLDAAARTGGHTFNSANSFAQPLLIRKQDSLDLTLQTSACAGNYRWRFVVEYRYEGDTRTHRFTSGAYYTYGTGKATQIYGGWSDSTGTIRVMSQQRWDGPSCSWNPPDPSALEASQIALGPIDTLAQSDAANSVAVSSSPSTTATGTTSSQPPATSAGTSTTASATDTATSTSSASATDTATVSSSPSPTP